MHIPDLELVKYLFAEDVAKEMILAVLRHGHKQAFLRIHDFDAVDGIRSADVGAGKGLDVAALVIVQAVNACCDERMGFGCLSFRFRVLLCHDKISFAV